MKKLITRRGLLRATGFAAPAIILPESAWAQFSGCLPGFCSPGAGGGGPPAGLTPTGAWSASRVVWPGYGGPFYTLTSSAVDTLYDQTGNTRHFAQSTAANRPTIVTAGPNSRAAVQFDATNDVLVNSVDIRTLVLVDRGYMIFTARPTSFTTSDGYGPRNNAIILDTDEYISMTVGAPSGNPLYFAFNYSGGNQQVTQTIAATNTYVFEWRHEGPAGNLFQRVNGAGETTIFSGFTFGGGTACLGGSTTHSVTFAGQIFEGITFNYEPTPTQRDALVQYLGTWVGASV